jgi:hypothetical protein
MAARGVEKVRRAGRPTDRLVSPQRVEREIVWSGRRKTEPPGASSIRRPRRRSPRPRCQGRARASISRRLRRSRRAKRRAAKIDPRARPWPVGRQDPLVIAAADHGRSDHQRVPERSPKGLVGQTPRRRRAVTRRGEAKRSSGLLAA